MLVGKTERREIPHEGGEWMEFRHLSGLQMDEAEETQTRRSLALVKGIDPAIMATWTADARQQVQAQGASGGYDKAILIRYGIAAWSYAEPCTDENKERLDAVTWDWAAAAIIEMNVRDLGEGIGSDGRLLQGRSRRSSARLPASEQPG